jgi:single-stranded DNA-binding protein
LVGRIRKNDKGEYETRTEWHRVYAWGNLSNFAKTLQKGKRPKSPSGPAVVRR